MRFQTKLLTLVFAFSLTIAFVMVPYAYSQVDLTLKFDGEPDTQAFPEIRTTVIVVDSHGIPIAGLDTSNFEAAEDGVQVPLTSVNSVINPNVPISVMLVIDASGSMAGPPLQQAKQSAISFIDGLGPDDQAAVIAFGDSIDQNVLDPAKEIDFTTDKNALKNLVNGLTTIRGVTETPLYDAIFKGVRMTSLHPTGNRVVIVFTDGKEGDAQGIQVSKLSSEAPIDEANEMNIPVYTIGLGKNADTNYMGEVALRTAGVYNFAPDAEKLQAIYQETADQLRLQYQLAYTSKAEADGQKHKLTVKANTPKGEVDNSIEFSASCPAGAPGIRLFYLEPSEVKGDEPDVVPLSEGFLVEDREALTIEPDISSCETIDRVDYYLNDVQQFSTSTPPYHFIWDIRAEKVSGPETPYTLKVQVYDRAATPNMGEKSLGLRVSPPRGFTPWPVWQIALVLVIALALLALVLYALRRRRSKSEPVHEAAPPPPLSPLPPTMPVYGEDETVPEMPSLGSAPGAVTAIGGPTPAAPVAGTVPEMPGIGSPGAPPSNATMILDQKPPVMAWLIVEKGDRLGQEYRLNDGDTTIGRVGTCDIILNDTTVSRQHAKIRLDNNEFYIHDLASTNPVKVNGMEITRHRLVEGDHIEIGETVLVFKRVSS